MLSGSGDSRAAHLVSINVPVSNGDCIAGLVHVGGNVVTPREPARLRQGHFIHPQNLQLTWRLLWME